MIVHGGRRTFLRKIVITALVGAVTFPLTNVLFQSQAEQLAMSAAAGSVILIIQFLIDVEHRLAGVEANQDQHAETVRQVVDDGFARINEATALFGRATAVGLKADAITELVRNAAGLGPDLPPLVSAFVAAELGRTSRLFREVADLEATYGGEDRDWLLTLTRCATTAVDAFSLPAVDAGVAGFDGGFWASDLGRRYLERQREAVLRGVRVRRVFVVEHGELADDPHLVRLCDEQAALGVRVRVLHPADVPSPLKSYLYDFILFDDVLSYEVTPSPQVGVGENPLILHTRLLLDPVKVQERRERYAHLWDLATPYAPDLPTQPGPGEVAAQQARRMIRRSSPRPR